MNLSGVQTFQQELIKQIEELNMETNMAEGSGGSQIGDTLRTLLPMGDGSNVALTEILVSEFNAESDCVMFYTTMIMEIGPGYEALKEMILDWNLLCPLGAFGIFRQERQFYHKYVFPFPKNLPPKKLADRTMYLLEVLYEVLSQRFPEAVQLSGHV